MEKKSGKTAPDERPRGTGDPKGNPRPAKELDDWMDKDAAKFMEDDREFTLKDGTVIKGSQVKPHLS